MNRPTVMSGRRAVATVAAMAVVGTTFAPMARADQDDVPCPLAMVLLCRMLPISPELDGDVDLTTPTVSPGREAAQSEPPAPGSPVGPENG